MGEGRRGADAQFVRAAVRQFERPLTSYAAHLVGDLDRARDIVQEAFLRLCGEERARVEPHLPEWLYTVCRNLAIDARRKDRRVRLLEDEPIRAGAAGGDDPADAAERADEFDRVMSVLSTLSQNQQEVIRLKFQHGLSYKQISDVTKLTVTNVGFLIHTAMKNLKGRLHAEPARGEP